MKILILLLFSSACYGQSFTDSTIIRKVVPATDSTPQTIVYIRYSTTYESAVANPLDSLLTINSNRRRTLVSPLQLPISTAQAAVNDSKLSTATAAATYQPIGNYLSAASLASYSTTAQANALYQPIGNYLTAVPAQSFASLTGKPTTLAGYGITDNVQPTLVSASNIKTINGVSVLGSGDLVVSGSGAPIRVFLPNDVVNNNGVANTISDVTGLSFPVVANTTYCFKFFIIYSSAATTTGSRWSINGPATTFLNYVSNYTINTGTPTFNWALSGYNLPAASNASSLTTNNIAIIEGVIRPSANGTVIARFASEILSSAITAIGSGRSYVEYQIIQ